MLVSLVKRRTRRSLANDDDDEDDRQWFATTTASSTTASSTTASSTTASTTTASSTTASTTTTLRGQLALYEAEFVKKRVAHYLALQKRSLVADSYSLFLADSMFYSKKRAARQVPVTRESIERKAREDFAKLVDSFVSRETLDENASRHSRSTLYRQVQTRFHKKPQHGVRTTGSAADAQIIDEFRTRILGHEPCVYVAHEHMCQYCYVPMTDLVEGSLVGCPQCHTVRELAVPLTMNMAVNALAGCASGVQSDGGGVSSGGGAGTTVFGGGSSVAMTIGTGAFSSAPGEPRMREILRKVQAKRGFSVKRKKQWVQDASKLMVKLRLTPFSKEQIATIRDAFLARGGEPWKTLADAAAELPPDILQTLQCVNGTYLRGIRVAVKHMANKYVQSVRSSAGTAASDDAKYEAMLNAAIQRVFRFNEDAPVLASVLTAFNPPRMAPVLEQVLLRMLQTVIPVYSKWNTTKSHFWKGYPYFMVSALSLLGRDEFLDLFNIPIITPEIEAARKLMWKELDWEFVSVINDPPPRPIVYVDATSTTSEESEQVVRTTRRVGRVILPSVVAATASTNVHGSTSPSTSGATSTSTNASGTLFKRRRGRSHGDPDLSRANEPRSLRTRTRQDVS